MTETTERLSDRVSALRARGGRREMDDRWLLIVGGLFLPLGIVLILLGWAGVSRNVIVYAQLPYLVSGGLLGLALVVVGGFLYFTYWQTVSVRESRTHHEESQKVLLRIEALLAGGGAADLSGPLVATPTGTQLHRATCAAVQGRTDARIVEPNAPGLTACLMCKPLTP
jgi:hypothetical protein